MFRKHDFVVYENSGVCEIEDVKALSFSDAEPRLCYILKPLFSSDGTIYTPVNNPRVFIRPVISREEALSIIQALPDAQPDSFDGLRTGALEEKYRRAVQSHRCKDLVRLALSISRRTRRARRAGKKVSEIDGRYLKHLHMLIYGEFSVALNISPDDVSRLIEKTLQKRSDI
ncbi:MAG: CarD family transcriptional regulator [Stomatobaculum sp.]